MLQHGSIDSRLHEVGTKNLPWACVDRRKGYGLHYGVAGGIDGLAQDVDAAMALQSHNRMPVQPEAVHIRAKILCKQLGGVGISIVNHNACAAIENRLVIADKIITDPEMVYTVAQSIDPNVSEDQVALLSEHYSRLRALDKIADPQTAKRVMATSDTYPAIDTISLEDSTYDPTSSRFIINDIEGIAFERTGKDYEFSLAAIRGLAATLRRDGLYQVTALPQAASIRAAAVKLVLPGASDQANGMTGPDIIRLVA